MNEGVKSSNPYVLPYNYPFYYGSSGVSLCKTGNNDEVFLVFNTREYISQHNWYIQGVLVGNDGIPRKNQFTIFTADVTNEQFINPRCAYLPQSNKIVVVAESSNRETILGVAGVMGKSVVYNIVDLGNPILIPQNPVGQLFNQAAILNDQVNPVVSALSDGSAVLYYRDVVSNQGYLRKIDANGNLQQSEVAISGYLFNTQYSIYNELISSHGSNGLFSISYQESSNERYFLATFNSGLNQLCHQEIPLAVQGQNKGILPIISVYNSQRAIYSIGQCDMNYHNYFVKLIEVNPSTCISDIGTLQVLQEPGQSPQTVFATWGANGTNFVVTYRTLMQGELRYSVYELGVINAGSIPDGPGPQLSSGMDPLGGNKSQNQKNDKNEETYTQKP